MDESAYYAKNSCVVSPPYLFQPPNFHKFFHHIKQPHNEFKSTKIKHFFFSLRKSVYTAWYSSIDPPKATCSILPLSSNKVN